MTTLPLRARYDVRPGSGEYSPPSNYSIRRQWYTAYRQVGQWGGRYGVRPSRRNRPGVLPLACWKARLKADSDW